MNKPFPLIRATLLGVAVTALALNSIVVAATAAPAPTESVILSPSPTTPQLVLEVRMVEVPKNPTKIDWTEVNEDPTGAPHDFRGDARNPRLTSGPVNEVASLSEQEMADTLRLLEATAGTEFLTDLQTVAEINKSLFTTVTKIQRVPKVIFDEQTSETILSGFVNLEYGTWLKVTPHIGPVGGNCLSVETEISCRSTIRPSIDTYTGSYNSVILPLGNTLVICGTRRLRGFGLYSKRERVVLIFITPILIPTATTATTAAVH